MSTPIGKPGRKFTFSVTINDGDGNPQDLSAVDDYALLASVGDQRIIAQWRKVNTEGFLQFTSTVDEANGIVEITLPAKNTQDVDNATVVIEPVVWINGEPFSSKDGISYELIKLKGTAKPII